MWDGILLALGGLGLFLLGMAVMTDGLKSLAHAKLRMLLAMTTRSPVSGAATGALATAMVQSSSATTVAAVGFVGAGLLTFTESLGIIYGANIGTTVTGWLVVLFGFKLKLSQILMPLILLGVLLRIFGQKHMGAAGFALAGFGLIFVGITTLQESMTVFSDVVTPEIFPDNTIMGRFLLVLIGVGITIVTQSSSAGVAIAVTAVHSGNITFPQAAAMVIGMNIGTTVTALIATVGGTASARRTGLAHVLYNLMTGIGTFILLVPLIHLLDWLAPALSSGAPEIALVVFHTAFNCLGLVAILPFSSMFAAMIERIVPERGNPLLQRLDKRLKQQSNLAVAAVEATLCDLVANVFNRLAAALTDKPSQNAVPLSDVTDAVAQTGHFLDMLDIPSDDKSMWVKHKASYHILDHLRRLIARLERSERFEAIRALPDVAPQVQCLAEAACQVALDAANVPESEIDRYHSEYRTLKSQDQHLRRRFMSQAAKGKLTVDAAMQQTAAIRSLRRMGYHVWRIIRELRSIQPAESMVAGQESPATQTAAN